jgi:hypothetical protein
VASADMVASAGMPVVAAMAVATADDARPNWGSFASL